jgi:hypothetical protein
VIGRAGSSGPSKGPLFRKVPVPSRNRNDDGGSHAALQLLWPSSSSVNEKARKAWVSGKTIVWLFSSGTKW